MFTKKRESGTSFWCTFSAWFFHKNVPSVISMNKVSMSYILSFSRHEKMCHKFLLRQLMTSQTLRFILDQTRKQWLTGKKRGRQFFFYFLPHIHWFCLSTLPSNYFVSKRQDLNFLPTFLWYLREWYEDLLLTSWYFLRQYKLIRK